MTKQPTILPAALPWEGFFTEYFIPPAIAKVCHSTYNRINHRNLTVEGGYIQ